jgi:hypothetical protein
MLAACLVEGINLEVLLALKIWGEKRKNLQLPSSMRQDQRDS